MYDFTYLIKKIRDKSFETEPFKHIYIENFFSEDHFSKIINATELISPVVNNDKDLIKGLLQKGFKIIPFPGCVTDIDEYIGWHEGNKKLSHHTACEGFGITLRLFEFQSKILKKLNEFLVSEDFNSAISDKFGFSFKDCEIDSGIQKYLDGYEISPHPDIRKKASTFMVNINSSNKSEQLNHHTHYLKLKKSYNYVEEFWKGNPNIDRAWIPWTWTDSIKQQVKNNSIVIFSPSNNTLHGVKADYNHLSTQRTQLYGNLWYKVNPAVKNLEWENLDLPNALPVHKNNLSYKQKITRLLPSNIKTLLRKIIRGKNSNIGKRDF